MKLYAPGYYNRFHCIADACKHSCCVGWEIDVDPRTWAIYQQMGDTYDFCLEGEDTPHFRLGKDERCPHLDEKGLCRLITQLGEGYLCDICREHPRFYHAAGGRWEVGLGACCEEAARLILEEKDYLSTAPVGDIPEEPLSGDFDGVKERETLYKTLSSLAYPDALKAVWEAWDCDPRTLPNALWRETFSEMEYLDDRHKQCFLSFDTGAKVPLEIAPYMERAFAYFVYRHTGNAADIHAFREGVFVAAGLERLLATLAMEAGCLTKEGLIPLLVTVSEEVEYSLDNIDALRFLRGM